jgi:hypothetical protein
MSINTVFRDGRIADCVAGSFRLRVVNDIAIGEDAGCSFKKVGDLHVFKFIGKVSSRRKFKVMVKKLMISVFGERHGII